MNVLLAILLQLGAVFCFTVMAALIRWVGERVPAGEVVFARSFFALVPLLIVLAWRREISAAVRTSNFTGHLARGLAGMCSMFFMFTGLALLPLADATAIGFAAPLMTVMLAVLVLGETVRIYRWSAVIVGFAGVLVMLYPLFADRTPTENYAMGAASALAGAFFTAFAMIQVRRLTATESTASIVFYFCVNASALSLLTIPFTPWVWPQPDIVVTLVGIGIVGGIGQIMLTESYRHGDASVVAPFGYSAILWSLVLGYLLFDELPDPIVLAGAAIVIAAGLFVIWRERQLGLDRSKATEASTPPALPPSG